MAPEKRKKYEYDYSKPKDALSLKERKKRQQEWKAHKRQKREEKLIQEMVQEKRNMEEAEILRKENELEKDVIKKGMHCTLSIALPGSIMSIVQSPVLATYLAGEIARAAVIFSVDEIIIFEETSRKDSASGSSTLGQDLFSDHTLQMGKILQYLECPQYLRKRLFPTHPVLKHVGMLPPLDSPHHLRESESSTFREGVVLDRPVKEGQGSFVDCGLPHGQEVQIDKQLPANTRVTVRLLPKKGDQSSEKDSRKRRLRGRAVSWALPTVEEGRYWGYRVRLAPSLGAVFTQSPYPQGYDLCIGTSDKGDSVDEVDIPEYRHAVLVFGGVAGLEACLNGDPDLDAEDPRELFDLYLNTCPGQSARTIRTKEAVLITLSALRPKLKAKN